MMCRSITAVSLALLVVVGSGCAVPVALPSWDAPPDITPALPAEFSVGSADTLVMVVRAAAKAPPIGPVLLDEPVFISPEKLPAIAEQLGRSGVYLGAVIILPFAAGAVDAGSTVAPVHELCLVAANGRTVSLFRPRAAWPWSEDRWRASPAASLDAVWRDQFVANTLRPKPAVLLPIWQSSPCRHVDWTGPVHLRWTDEQRDRVRKFLQALPLPGR